MIDTIRQKIQEVFVPYDHYVPAEVIKRLFMSIPSDETTLTQEIMGYLLEHNYEPLQSLRGESQRERLISTDWRQKEVKNWLPEPEHLAVPGLSNVSVHPIPTPLSQSNKVLISFVILFVTILLWLWNSKLSEIGDSPVETSEIEQTTVGRAPAKEITATLPVASPALPKKTLVTTVKKSGVQNTGEPGAFLGLASQPATAGTPEPVGLPKAETVKSYDAVDDQVGDFGLRAARKGSKWGYVDPNDQWQINPVFDDVMPFHNGKAIVILDGQQITIDRDGTRIREDN